VAEAHTRMAWSANAPAMAWLASGSSASANRTLSPMMLRTCWGGGGCGVSAIWRP
jgi:hypothetical protein